MRRGVVKQALWLGLVVALVVFLLSACSGGGGNAEQEQAEASRMPAESGKSLSAGRYTTETFKPALSFSVGKGWHTVVPDTPQTFAVGQEGGSLYVSFWNVQHVFNPKNPTLHNLLPDPNDMAAWLQEHPNLDAEEPEKVTIGGVSGVQFDAVASSIPQNYPSDCPEPCVPLFATDQEESFVSSFGLLQSEKLRFIVLDDVEGETVTIAVGGRAVNFEEFLPKAQKVLKTAEWEGAS